jgi:hypothetical protein
MAPLLAADPLELTSLVAQRLSSGLQVDARSGYLRTADGTALLLKVRPRFAPMKWELGEQLVADASRLAVELGGEVATDSFTSGARPKVAFTGSYAFPPYFRRWMEQDMTLSTLLSVGSVLLLVWGVFPLAAHLAGGAAATGAVGAVDGDRGGGAFWPHLGRVDGVCDHLDCHRHRCPDPAIQPPARGACPRPQPRPAAARGRTQDRSDAGQSGNDGHSGPGAGVSVLRAVRLWRAESAGAAGGAGPASKLCGDADGVSGAAAGAANQAVAGQAADPSAAGPGGAEA